MSKLQDLTGRMLRTKFKYPDYTVRENHRPEWMVTDNGERLELDFYIEEIDIAIEVQGKQHYVLTPFFHGTEDGFKEQIRRDQEKHGLCDSHGTRLLFVSDEYEATATVDQLWNESCTIEPEGQVGFPDTKITKKFNSIRERLETLNNILDSGDCRRYAVRFESLRVAVDSVGIETFQIYEPELLGEAVKTYSRFRDLVESAVEKPTKKPSRNNSLRVKDRLIGAFTRPTDNGR